MGNASGFDIHAHFYLQAYLDLIAAEGARFGVRFALTEDERPVEIVTIPPGLERDRQDGDPWRQRPAAAAPLNARRAS